MMTRKTSILTVLMALLVLAVSSSMAQQRIWDLDPSPGAAPIVTVPGDGGENGDALTVVLEPDQGTFDLIPSPGGGGPFYIGGTLFDVDTGEELGDFQCWGWFFTAERRMVTQEYNVGDRGTIILAGEENNTLAIVGGTGDFRGAGGESTAEAGEGGFLIHFSFGDDDDDDDSGSDD